MVRIAHVWIDYGIVACTGTSGKLNTASVTGRGRTQTDADEHCVCAFVLVLFLERCLGGVTPKPAALDQMEQRQHDHSDNQPRHIPKSRQRQERQNDRNHRQNLPIAWACASTSSHAKILQFAVIYPDASSAFVRVLFGSIAIHQRKHQLALACQLPIDAGDAFAAPDTHANLVELDLQPQRVAGHNRPLEAHIVQPSK